MSVCLSVGRLVCRNREPCKNSRTDQDAVLVVDLGGPKEPRSAKMLLVVGATSSEGFLVFIMLIFILPK